MIDTHAHIYLPEFESDITSLLDKAQRNGVEKILMPNIGLDSIEPMLKLSEMYTNFCYPMMGLHPSYVNTKSDEILANMFALFSKHDFVGVGEIGIDLYWKQDDFLLQKAIFLQQCEWAIDLNLPVAVHSREATSEVLEIMEPLAKRGLKGVLHCFSGSEIEAKRAINAGFYLGVGGVVTFKKSGLDMILQQIPINSIVLETDSPYLAPTPHRGKRNEPYHLNLILQRVAEIYLKGPQEVKEITTKNAISLFPKCEQVKH